jgi:hypothetical protein
MDVSQCLKRMLSLYNVAFISYRILVAPPPRLSALWTPAFTASEKHLSKSRRTLSFTAGSRAYPSYNPLYYAPVSSAET